MVSKANELPVITPERRESLNKLIKYIDLKLDEQHLNKTKRILLHTYYYLEVPAYSKWMDTELIRTYKEEGVWKHVRIVHEKFGDVASNSLDTTLLISNNSYPLSKREQRDLRDRRWLYIWIGVISLSGITMYFK
jgi:hypothetical protein